MKLTRFELDGEDGIGVVSGNGAVPTGYRTLSDFIADGERAIERADEQSASGEVVDVSRPLVPFTQPGKMLFCGLTHEHARVGKPDLPPDPFVFAKLPHTLTASREDIVLPYAEIEACWEVEVAIIIGRRASEVSIEEAEAHIFGYGVINDISPMNEMTDDWMCPITLLKNYDTFCPIGPEIRVARDFDTSDLKMTTHVNGEVRQQGSTADLVFPIPELVSWLSHRMTLYPGDVIGTGSPAGVEPAAPGDEITCEVEGVGAVTNPVVAKSASRSKP
ncbi:MAG: fumarylacetoacetate hydrolase family protein [Solirubrobacterales bacterium]